MDRSIPVTLTNMCMVYDGDKILVQNKTGQDWSGLTFPGGHVENGESFVASTIREVYEETGLIIEHPVLCGIKEWQNADNSRYVVFFFKTNQYSGNLTSSEEGEVFWIHKADLKNYKLVPDFEEMFQIFENDSLSELYYYRENDILKKEIY